MPDDPDPGSPRTRVTQHHPFNPPSATPNASDDLRIAGDEPIRLIVADIDGCLSAGTGHPFDHDLLQTLAWANRESRTNSTVPAITLCTGRPQPYAECLLQAIHGYHPALCENGSVIFNPANHDIFHHPDYGPEEAERLEELHRRVATELCKSNVQPEPGKMTHITLIVQPPDTPAGLYPRACEIAAEFGDTFQVELTSICVHILFRHIHKGIGVQWLSHHTGIPLSQMAGIGDAAPDIAFLCLVGHAYAPANAEPAVKEICHSISPLCDAQAARHLLQQIIEHNKNYESEEASHLLP